MTKHICISLLLLCNSAMAVTWTCIDTNPVQCAPSDDEKSALKAENWTPKKTGSSDIINNKQLAESSGFQIYNSNNQLIVNVDTQTGKVTYGKGYKADKASTDFWKTLGHAGHVYSHCGDKK